jgi:hypothetical protein
MKNPFAKAASLLKLLPLLALSSAIAQAGGIHCRYCGDEIEDLKCLPRAECSQDRRHPVEEEVFGQSFCASEGSGRKLEWRFDAKGEAVYLDSFAGAPDPDVRLRAIPLADAIRFDIVAFSKSTGQRLGIVETHRYIESLDLISGGPANATRTYESCSD